MTDYYPLLARAVAGLEKNTGEARRALYERARNALLAQLRSTTPPLSEPEITRERLALEEAVRKVEAEAARRARFAAPPPRPSPPRPSPPLPDKGKRPSKPEEGAPGAAASPPGKPEPYGPPTPEHLRTTETTEPPRKEDGVKGLRDVVADAESLGDATAQASRTAREAYAAVPSDVPELDRVEPRVEPAGLRPPPRERTRPAPPPPPGWAPPGRPTEDISDEPIKPRRPPGPLPRRTPDFDTEEPAPNPARRGLIAALVTVLVITSLGAAAYWQRERISALFGVVRGLGPQGQKAAAPARPKIEDRVGQESAPAGQPNQQQSGTPSTKPAQPPPAVAQRVVLYEEDPSNPQGNRYVGSALWRTETVSPGPGLSPELAVRVDVEVPERRMQMTMSIRRNTDQALPASHTVEIMFTLPSDFPFGGVANVPGLLMKEAEQARGAPLSGLAVKVTNGFFLIGLSAVEADRQRNVQLLRERSWFDIPIVYNNGRRAILALEKGNPGERAFEEAFTAWRP
ncbi:MAG TPA: hypothetical protein VFQ27_09840 [Xanthobacteraceae bacterium]|nr:hypothetical protein [Xanthobacteraceae bacterium]